MNNNGWMPIESAPKSGVSVLGFFNEDWIEGVFWNGSDWAFLSDGDMPTGRFKPTHWQPLPPPPGDAA